jgi:16S rRNA processing protein RimM
VPTRFEPGSTVFLEQDAARSMRVVGSRPDRDRVLIVFEGIEDRTRAEALAGAYLFVPASWAPVLSAGEYWEHELIGSEVQTEDGRRLGLLSEILHTQANDVWVVAGPDGGEVLVPALKDVVAHVDVAGRRIVVRDVDGEVL